MKQEEEILVYENLEAALEDHSLPIWCSGKEPPYQLKETREIQI